MSLLPQQTTANANLFYFLKGNGLELTVSTLNAENANITNLSTAVASVSSLTGNFLSSIEVDAEYINNSTINTLHVDLDGQILTATATELLLNGVPLATTSNLSSIADWSYDPAISTVQMQGNDLNAAGTVSSLNVRAGNGFFQNLIAFNALFVSTATSTLSTQINVADLGLYSSIGVGSLTASSTTTSSLSAIAVDISGLTVSSIGAQYLTVSSMTASNYLSTPSLFVSSINGSEFTSTGITVQVAGVSSLVANSISSIGAELRTALVSTLQFNPSFSPSFQPNVNLGLGSILGNVIGWGAGVFGAAAGTVGLVTGMFALASGRQQNFIDNTRFELINGTTQLQFSTLGSAVSSVFRVSDSVSPDQIPGSTLYVSTILPAGTLALRSVSDPINTVSTPNSTIQAFGPWSAVPPEVFASSFTSLATSSLEASTIQTLQASVSSVIGLSSINGVPIGLYENTSSFEWAFFPAISTVNFSTGVAAVIAAAPGSDIALTGTSIKLIGGYTDAQNLLLASTISTAVVLGANDNLFGVGGIRGLKLDAPNLFISSVQTNITGLINCSTIDSFATNTRAAQASTLAVSSINGFEFPQPVVSSFETASISSLSVSSINGLPSPLSTFETASISSATISSINGHIFTPVTSAYTSNVLWPNLSTTTNVVASTSITTYISSYIVAIANTTVQNTSGQYHDSFFYLTIDGATGPSTVTTALNKNGSHLGQTISYRAYVGPGTWPLTANAYADANGDLVITQIELSGTGGLQ